MGLDLEQHSSSDSDESKMSLDKDKNDDIQLGPIIHFYTIM